MNLRELRERLSALEEKRAKLYGEVVSGQGGEVALDWSKASGYEKPQDARADMERWAKEHDDLAAQERELRTVADQKAAFDRARERNGEVKSIVGPQVGAPGIGSSPLAYKSIGEQLVASKEFAARTLESGHRGVRIELSDAQMTNLIHGKDLFMTSDWPSQTIDSRGPVTSADRQLNVSAAYPVGTTDRDSVSWLRETTFTQAATETAEFDDSTSDPSTAAEGVLQEADIGLTRQSAPIELVGVQLPITEQTLNDESRMRSYADMRLRYQVNRRLDQQILLGNGTSPNLIGMSGLTGIGTYAQPGDSNPIAAVRRGQRLVRVGGGSPSAIFVSPADMESLDILQEATTGAFIMGHPSSAQPRTLFGVPLIETGALSAGTIYLGDCAGQGEIVVQRGMVVDTTNSHGDDFIHMVLRMRATIFVAVCHYQPSAFAQLTSISF